MSESLDFRTKDNRWIVKRWAGSGEYEIVDNAYDAWLRQRTVTPDGRTQPDQAAFFAGWNALREWLMFGLGFEGRLSDYQRPQQPPAARAEEVSAPPSIPYEDIDCEIRRLVRLINEFPGIRTVSSCAGHDGDHETEVDVTAESQGDLVRLFAAMPFWNWSAGFENNWPVARAIWMTASPGSGEAVIYKLRLAGWPKPVRWALIDEVEGALSVALTRQRGPHPSEEDQ